MKENKYDNRKFFEQYKLMDRSKYGLDGAGEWHELKKLLPDFKNQTVLDLGCGMGWHCKYAVEKGARQVIGIDLSKRMLEVATDINNAANITYIQMPIEEVYYPIDTFDTVMSSLVFHYIESFDDICKKVNHCLKKGGSFVFSVEHPIFTAQGKQDWHYNEQNEIMHWPVDSYFDEGLRQSIFLGEEVLKYHKTLTTYINTLIQNGFEITNVVEPMPEEKMLENDLEMQNELRRPMMLLISAKKK